LEKMTRGLSRDFQLHTSVGCPTRAGFINLHNAMTAFYAKRQNMPNYIGD
jgi:hypothetical protein